MNRVVQKLEHWDGWGEFFLIGKFPEYQGPTLVKMFRMGVKLTSYQLAKCVMSGKHGEISNWGKWTPTPKERYFMLIAAEASADREEAENDALF